METRTGRKFGHIVTEETRKKLSEYFKKNPINFWSGKKRPKVSLETRIKRRNTWLKNKEKHKVWKGGISTENKRIRSGLEYRLWRESVFKRDNWTCLWCNKKGGKLNADHIKPFALYPELRFAIDNGRTLCIDCHRKTDTFGFNTFKKKYG